MAKGINAKKNVKKEPAKTPKEKKAEKKLKKGKQLFICTSMMLSCVLSSYLKM